MAVIFAAWVGLLDMNAELFTTSAGVEHQERTHGVYGRAFLADDHYYKLLLYRATKPRVLALGSSRTMQFRQTFFDPSQRFMTAGGAMQSLAEGHAFAEEALVTSTPDMVVLGLDYWWFNDNSGVPDRYRADDAKYESYAYVVAASVSALPRLAAHTFWLAPLPEPFSRAGAVGARARAFGDGFRLDGSHNAAGYYAGTIRDARTLDANYSYTLDRVRHETHPFEGGDEVSATALAQYARLLDLFQARGIRVSVFLPPFAPEVAVALAGTGRHAVFERVRAVVRQATGRRGIPFHDFTTVPYKSRNCYEDGFHAGEYVYANIVRDIVPVERTNREALDLLLGDPARSCDSK